MCYNLQFSDSTGSVTFNDHASGTTVGTFSSSNAGTVHKTGSNQAMVIGDRKVAGNTFSISWKAVKSKINSKTF